MTLPRYRLKILKILSIFLKAIHNFSLVLKDQTKMFIFIGSMHGP